MGSATGKELRTVRVLRRNGEAWLRPFAFSPDGKTIALEEAARARAKEGNVTNVFTEYRLPGKCCHRQGTAATGRDRLVIWSAAFAPDSAVACQRMDGSVSAWDTETGKAVSPNEVIPAIRVRMAGHLGLHSRRQEVGHRRR